MHWMKFLITITNNQEKCEKAAEWNILEDSYVFGFVPDLYKTRGMCERVVERVLNMLKIIRGMSRLK